MASTAGKVATVCAVLAGVALAIWAVLPSGDDTSAGAATIGASSTPVADTTASTSVTAPTLTATTGTSPNGTTETTASAIAPETPDTVVDNGHIVGTGTVQASNADVVPRTVDASAPNRDQLMTQLTGLLTQYYTVLPADDTAAWKSRVAPYVTDPKVLNDLNFALDALGQAPSKKRLENQTKSIGVFDIATLQAESENPANTEYYILISVTLQTTKPDGSLFDTPQTIRNGTNWKFDGTTWVLTRFSSTGALRR